MIGSVNRVVVTGMGAITPIGNDINTFWNSLIEGRGGVRTITRVNPDDVPCKIGAEVKDFDPLNYLTSKEVRRMDRFVQYSIAASEMAIQDAQLQLDRVDLDEVGVTLGTAFGALESMIDGQNSISAQPPKRLGPYFFPKTLANMGAAQVAMRYGPIGFSDAASIRVDIRGSGRRAQTTGHDSSGYNG